MKLKQLMKRRDTETSEENETMRTSADGAQIDEEESTYETGDSSIILKPSTSDVLFGRGKPFQSHPGNLHLHEIVNQTKERYLKSRRLDKLAIAKEIVQEIKSGGKEGTPGRFLKRAEGDICCWTEVSDDVAREKVSHALRDRPRKLTGSHTEGDFPTEAASTRSISGAKRAKIEEITSRLHHAVQAKKQKVVDTMSQEAIMMSDPFPMPQHPVTLHWSQQVHDTASRHISYDATWYHPHYLATRSYSTWDSYRELLKLCRPGWGLPGLNQS
jgi:hypothetical protein